MGNLSEALAYARATRTLLGSVLDPDNWERKQLTILADEIDRLQAENKQQREELDTYGERRTA